MLNAWHLPVAPFVKQNKDNLVITLWLAGDNQPERVTLRAEVDNEETSLKMHKVRSQPQPGVTAWRANIDLRSGQPRRRYGFKLLWNNRQLWFTPQGFSRFPPARLEQFAVDHPDNGPQWVDDQVFYQICIWGVACKYKYSEGVICRIENSFFLGIFIFVADLSQGVVTFHIDNLCIG